MLLDLFKILGFLVCILVCSCEIVCSMVGIAFIINYLLSDLPQNEHNRQLQELESDEFFDEVWEDSAKHGPVNLEDYDKFKH